MSSSTPLDFVHLFQDKRYLESIAFGVYYKIVGKVGNYGRRMFFGPLCVEYYTGDKEPVLEPFFGLRFVIWTPVTREDIPKSWFRLFKKPTREVCALIDIRNTRDYYTLWNNTFRTYYYHFSKQKEYKVERIPYEEFNTLYKRYAKKLLSSRMCLDQLATLSAHPEVVYCYILKHLDSNEIVAGIASADCLEVKQSYYVAAFTRKSIAPKEAGLWLLNYWMNECSARGALYANLGNMWTEGKPVSWKGFSDFKMKFRPTLLILKPELVKFTFSLQ